ncbi:MAG: hypothetical protein LQ345_000751 [Seirophora villosa]|nr:MAG: hypothetical protein LQ345_000751 [Seirophora villosa]
MFKYWSPQSTRLAIFIFATTIVQHATAAVAQPSGNLIQRPAQQEPSKPSAITTNSIDILEEPGDKDYHFICLPSLLHPIPDLESCAEAIKHIPDGDEPLRSFSDPSRFLQLPHRFSSSDGKCVVLVTTTTESFKTNVMITGKRLRFFATEILSKCVAAQKMDGDVYVPSGQYMVLFDHYDPSGIKCADRSPEPPPSGCQGALEMMPVDGRGDVRYLDGEKVNPWDVELPMTFLGPQAGEKSTCMILLDVTGEEYLMPRKMWEAAVAVEAYQAVLSVVGNYDPHTRYLYSAWMLPTVMLAIGAVVVLDGVSGYYLPALKVQDEHDDYAGVALEGEAVSEES